MKKALLLLLTIQFFSCTEQPKVPENVVAKADTLVSPAVKRGLAMGNVSLDSLVVMADAKGGITVGGQAVSDLEQLEKKLVDTLQFMQKTYGKLPDTILYRSKGEVLMGTRGAIHDAISDAKAQVAKQ